MDLKSAQAFNPSDRDNIFKAVEATAGFGEVNKVVIEIMRRWMVESGKGALLGLPDERAVSTLQNNLARLLYDQGKLSEAEPLYREALEGRRRTLGDTHPGTLVSINNLGKLLYTQGKLSEAEPLYREAVGGAEKNLGDEHPRTVKFQENTKKMETLDFFSFFLLPFLLPFLLSISTNGNDIFHSVPSLIIF